MIKLLYSLISLSLLTFSFSTVTFDLSADQSYTAAATITITLTASNSADTVITATGFTGLKIVEDGGSGEFALTCTGTTIPATGTPGTVSCTVSGATAGTYKLDRTSTVSVTTDGSPVEGAAIDTTTMTITAASQNQDPPAQSGITISLKTGQSVNIGSNVAVKLTLTSTSAATVKTLTGLSLVKNDDNSVTTTLTCSATTAVSITASGSAEFSCTAATLSTAGTYKLIGNSVAGTDDSNGALSVTLTVSSANTIAVTTANENNNNNNNNENSSKYLNISALFVLLFFF